MPLCFWWGPPKSIQSGYVWYRAIFTGRELAPSVCFSFWRRALFLLFA